MKSKKIQTIIKGLLTIVIVLITYLSNPVYAQSCIACDGDKTTCGLPDCDITCNDCNGPDIPVDNGVWLLVIAGVILVSYWSYTQYFRNNIKHS